MSSDETVKYTQLDEVQIHPKSKTFGECIISQIEVNTEMSALIKNYITNFLQSNPELLTEVQNSFDVVVKDGKINSEDVPELMLLMLRISPMVTSDTLDRFDLLTALIETLFIAFLDYKHIDDPNIKTLGITLIVSSMKLIKLQLFSTKKHRYCCF